MALLARPRRDALRTRNQQNRLIGLAIVSCAAVTLTACGSSDDKPEDEAKSTSSHSSTPSPATSSSTADEPQEAAKQAVLTAYAGMTAEQSKAYKKASASGTDLKKYANLNALSKIELDLASMQEAGTVVRGEIGHDATIAGLDLDAKPPKATISDCVDLANYQTYDTMTKKVIPLPSQQPLQYVVTAKAEKFDNGQWMVTDINTQGGPTC